MSFRLRFVMVAVAGLLSASPVMAQQAEAAGGPLHEGGGVADMFSMVVATPPPVRPTQPVEAWEWHFYSQTRDLAGAPVDTVAFRMRVDCAAETRQPLAIEAFLDGTRVSGRQMTAEP